MKGENVLFDDLESGEAKKTSFDKRLDAYRDIAKEFGQPISMVGVMSVGEIEVAIFGTWLRRCLWDRRRNGF